MDPVIVWFVVIGGLFIGVALSGSLVSRLPLSTSMLYLGVGILLGPSGSGLLSLEPVADATLLERLSEIAVIVSLFTAGLKLRRPLSDRRWMIAVRLAVVSMALTVVLVAAAAVMLLGLPWGVGIVLGAILAPTDPVLASDVQVGHPFDDNRLRFGLTGEASLNDGTAFPFLLLGLGLLGLHDLGAWAWKWMVVDVLWAVSAGLAIGGALGTAVGKLVLYLRRTHREAIGLDDFLALGLVALAYGVALACHAYGFLAVFAAGLALRRVERLASGSAAPGGVEALARSGMATEDIAAHEHEAPAYMAQAVLAFNEQLERIGEITVVVVLGAMLSAAWWRPDAVLFVPLLLLGVRPLSAALGLVGARLTRREHLLIGWFGIRGIGSVYYLMYAITHGLPEVFTGPVVALTLSTVTASIVVHGATVTPVMNRWGEKRPGA